ncbi:MAG: Tellurite resistance protein TehB [uncultured Sulfurovum sp.]|uniref:Tellurite resistance protein TehB n=1 Tax=uncultured Sulfurovum sp. TaxID=269237 RepID=A0A6S6UF30_9BACT|nr:MAG: Tellurite resistance protein TehB [uncultured Sulfurovum sp.]
MAHADKVRWNEKYQDSKIPNEPISLVVEYATTSKGKQALDIACGMGRHSRYLSNNGFHVDALDISSVAISQLKDLPYITPQEVDFDTYTLKDNSYDLIVCTYYLERTLFPQMIAALKAGGILIFETFLYDEENERAPSNPDFILQKGELESAFEPSCKLLKLTPWWDKDYQGYKTLKISMVAQKY